MVKQKAGILLIEDDRIDIMTVQRVLRRQKFDRPLYVARTAVDALSMLRGEGHTKIDPTPALVLLDLNLPRMSGIEFLKELRNDPEFHNLSVIVLTSSNEPNDRATAFQYEVEDYVVKPHSFDEFAETLETVLAYALPQDH